MRKDTIGPPESGKRARKNNRHQRLLKEKVRPRRDQILSEERTADKKERRPEPTADSRTQS
jgi:hypothetical protein